MGLPPLLDEKCVSRLTSTYTNLSALTPTLAKECAYHIYSEPTWRKNCKTLLLILIVLAIICIVWALCSTHTSNIKRLRNLPPQHLHREMEREYQKRCMIGKAKKKAWEDAGLEGRYVKVEYVDDREARTRSVTIVEDLTKAPYQVQYTGSAGTRTVYQSREAELRERNAAESGAGYRGMAPTQAQQPSPFVSARVGTPSVAAPTAPSPAAGRNGNGNGNEQEQEQSGYEYMNNGAAPPPPYKQHQWQSIV